MREIFMVKEKDIFLFYQSQIIKDNGARIPERLELLSQHQNCTAKKYNKLLTLNLFGIHKINMGIKEIF